MGSSRVARGSVLQNRLATAVPDPSVRRHWLTTECGKCSRQPRPVRKIICEIFRRAGAGETKGHNEMDHIDTLGGAVVRGGLCVVASAGADGICGARRRFSKWFGRLLAGAAFGRECACVAELVGLSPARRSMKRRNGRLRTLTSARNTFACIPGPCATCCISAPASPSRGACAQSIFAARRSHRGQRIPE